ncbi:MAG: hypothetical protein IJT42_09690 [Treponema sp.]|nr:hypothetical protein [Treponema sp.]
MELTESKETDIEFALYTALKETISANVDAEITSRGNSPPPFPKETLVEKIIQKNFDELEKSVYMTRGRDGKLYLTGSWLMRPVLHQGKMIPTMEYLKLVIDTSDIVFAPEKNGAELRKSLWK